MSALVAVVADVGLLALTSKQVFAHYVTPALPFVFLLFAAGARAAFANRRLKVAMLALATIVCAGGIESTLAISRRIDGRNGLAVHRAVAGRVLDDCGAAGRPVDACPARLDFGFIGMTYTYANLRAHGAADADSLGVNPEQLRLSAAKTRRSAPARRGRVRDHDDRPREPLPSSMMCERSRASDKPALALP